MAINTIELQVVDLCEEKMVNEYILDIGNVINKSDYNEEIREITDFSDIDIQSSEYNNRELDIFLKNFI